MCIFTHVTYVCLVSRNYASIFTFNNLGRDSPSYPPPHFKHLARSFPVPSGITPTGGCSAYFTLSAKDR